MDIDWTPPNKRSRLGARERDSCRPTRSQHRLSWNSFWRRVEDEGWWHHLDSVDGHASLARNRINCARPLEPRHGIRGYWRGKLWPSHWCWHTEVHRWWHY